MLLPKKKSLICTSSEDPHPFYYKPFIKYFYRYRLQMILNLLGNHFYNNIIDIGYGSGILFPELSQRSRSVSGVDIHDLSGPVSKTLNDQGVCPELKNGEIVDIPFGNEMFDGVVALSVLEYIRDLDRAIKEILRVTTKDALIVIGIPSINIVTALGHMLNGTLTPFSKYVQDERNILKKMDEYFILREIHTFPDCVPLAASLFVSASYVKKYN